MIAIFKREYKSYFISMIGYIFIAMLLMVVGLCYYWINLHNANPFIGYSLQYSYVQIAFMVLVPVVTMRIFADERRLKTDQLLLTAPVTVTKIVMGKFLAIAAVFVIPIAVICIYPIMLMQYGTINVAMSYVCILGFFLMGLAYISIGMFVSSLTESSIISAVVTFIILMFSFMISSLTSVIPSTAIVSFVVFVALAAIVGAIIGMLTRDRRIGFLVGAVLELVVIVLYIVKSSIFEGLIQKVLLQLSISGYYDKFVGGVLDLRGVIYYISVIIFFLFLTVQSVEKRRYN
ncbi:MAG: ABC transporter permease [Lachnospiraceae bacterium]|nr:ABC transporter permease [Lachnospiraceae bacterium]